MPQTATAPEQPRLLNVRAAARYLGIAHSTLYDLINRREIRSIKTGPTKQASRFIEVAELDRWIARNSN